MLRISGMTGVLLVAPLFQDCTPQSPIALALIALALIALALNLRNLRNLRKTSSFSFHVHAKC